MSICRTRKSVPVLAFCALGLLGAAAAAAQTGGGPPPGAAPAGGGARGVGAPSIGRRTGWQADLGAAVIANPEFQGGEDYRVLPVPYFDVRYVDREGTLLFANVPQGLGGYFLRRRDERGRGFSAGASLAPGFSNRNPEDFPGLETFGTGLEARLLLDYGGTNWGAQARLAQGVAGGHEGMYLDLGASWRGRIPGKGFFAVGPNLRVGDDQYMNALYGVTDAESEATGLDSFGAGAGLEAVSVQGLVSIGLSRRWRFTTIARLGRLTGDAADSSLTQTKTQIFFLSAVTRSF